MTICNILSVDKCPLLLNEEMLQYLVILDEDTEVCYSLSYRNGDVSSVWTEVFNGRVWTFRDLNGRCLRWKRNTVSPKAECLFVCCFSVGFTLTS